MTAFKNVRRARQLIEFENMQYKLNVGPVLMFTDMDAWMEWRGHYVMVEAKYLDANMPAAQARAYRAMADVLDQGKGKSLFILARHEVNNPEEHIDLADCEVDSYRHAKKWTNIPYGTKLTVKELVDQFLITWGLDSLYEKGEDNGHSNTQESPINQGGRPGSGARGDKDQARPTGQRGGARSRDLVA